LDEIRRMKVALNRRTIVLGLPLIGAAPLGFVAAKNVREISGALTGDNYGGFEAFLLDSLESIVGLKIGVTVNDQDTEGNLSAYERENQFTIYRAGAGEVAELVFNDSYEVDGGECRIDGFFSVSQAGMHGGVATLLLESDDAPDGAKIEEFDIDNLPAGIQN
jgi:hypothetical protein